MTGKYAHMSQYDQGALEAKDVQDHTNAYSGAGFLAFVVIVVLSVLAVLAALLMVWR